MCIKILYNPNSKWISLYTDAIDTTTIREIKKISSFYYQLFSTDIIASHVFDSDTLIMSLYSKKKDLYVSDKDSVNLEIFSYNPNTTKGTVTKWKHLIDNQYNEEDLEKIWEEDYVFAEEKLVEIAKLLGIDETLINKGLVYFQDINKNKLDNYEIIELGFSSKFKPYEIIYNTGLPRFVEDGSYKTINISRQRGNHVSFRNFGGKSKGFVLEITGVDTNLIKFESAIIFQGKLVRLPDYHRPDEINVHIVEMNVDSKNKIIADFSDYYISPGITVKYLPEIQKNKIISVNKILNDIFDKEETCIYRIRFNVKSNGLVNNDIQIRIIPIENPEGFIQYNSIITNDQSFL